MSICNNPKRIWEFPLNNDLTGSEYFVIDNKITTQSLTVSGLTNYIGAVTGGTYYPDGTLVLEKWNGTVSITGFTTPFTGNTASSCITDLYLSNLYGCNDIHIQPASNNVYLVESAFGSVVIGQNSGFGVGKLLQVNGGLETQNGSSIFNGGGNPGVVTDSLQVTTSPVNGYVLTSDASGNATWQEEGYVTAFTFNLGNYDLRIAGTKGLDITRSLSILATDMKVTGGTYNPSNGVATFTNNSGGTFDVSGFLTGYTDFYVTSGSYSNGTITLTRSDSGTVIITGLTSTDSYVTGFTYDSNKLTVSQNQGKSDLSLYINNFTGLTVNGTLSATTYVGLPIDPDNYVTGGTYSSGILTLNRQNGSVTVSGLLSADTFVTGFTYSNNNLTISQNQGQLPLNVYINTFTGLTIDGVLSATTYLNLPIDNYVTGGTYSGGILTLNRTDGGSVIVTGFSSTFTGNTSANCITDLFVQNINSCSPLHIQNFSSGDVYLVENDNGNVGINTSSPSARLHVKGVDDTSSYYGLKVVNSGNTDLLSVRNDGVVIINNNTTPINSLRLYVRGQGATNTTSSFAVGNSSNSVSFIVSDSGSIAINDNPSNESSLLLNGSNKDYILLARGTAGDNAIQVRNSNNTVSFAGDVGVGLNSDTISDARFKVIAKSGTTGAYIIRAQKNPGGVSPSDSFTVRDDATVSIGGDSGYIAPVAPGGRLFIQSPNANFDTIGSAVALKIQRTDGNNVLSVDDLGLTNSNAAIRLNLGSSSNNNTYINTYSSGGLISLNNENSNQSLYFGAGITNFSFIYNQNTSSGRFVNINPSIGNWIFSTPNFDSSSADANTKVTIYSSGNTSSKYGLRVVRTVSTGPSTFSTTDLLTVRNDGVTTIGTTPTLNNSATQILVRNSSTGDIEYRDLSTISGSTSTGSGLTAFTYNDNNKLTISTNQGDYSQYINIFSGLTINGNVTTNSLQVSNGVTNGYVLTSDASGNATWQEEGYVTAFTFNVGNYDLNISGTKGLNITRSLGILATDMTVTGGTYDPNTGVVTFINNSGGTFQVSGFTTGYTDSYINSGTYSPTTGILNLVRSTGQNFNVSGSFLTNVVTGGSYSNGTLILNRQNGPINVTGFTSTDIYVTGFTYNSNKLTLSQNQGQSDLNVYLNNFTGLTVNGTISATTYTNLPRIYVTGGTFSANTTTGLGALTLSTQGSPISISGFTDTFVTGFTYDNSNKLTLSQNNGKQNIVAYLNTFSGLTVNGVISATTYTNLPRIYVTGGTFSATTSGFGTLTLSTQGSPISITGINDGSVSAFTYDNKNTFTIGQQGGRPAYSANVSIMTGLTINASGQYVQGFSPNPAGTLVVSGTTTLIGPAAYTLNVTGGTKMYNQPGNTTLLVIGSGTTTPLFSVQGSFGELFSVVDNLYGSLFSVNDVSGLPVIEAFSDSTILMGSYLAPSLNTTARVLSTSVGINNVYSITTSAYTGAYYDYTLSSGTTAYKAGSIVAVWDNTGSVSYTEDASATIGSPNTYVSMGVSGNTNFVTLYASGNTAGWTVKSIIRSI